MTWPTSQARSCFWLLSEGMVPNWEQPKDSEGCGALSLKKDPKFEAVCGLE